MLGLMQSQPLLISSLIDFAERHHGDARDRVAPRRGRHPPLHLARRRRRARGRSPMRWTACKLQFSDRVATLAWNGYRHLELYYAVSRFGRACCTRSIRACIRSRSPRSPTTPKTRRCSST